MNKKIGIGRSYGAEINFKLNNKEDQLTVYTTRPDTVFGVTLWQLLQSIHYLKNIKMKSKTMMKY